MKGKILLPLDASEASLKAFTPAKSIAELLEMNLFILHICEENLSTEELLKKLKIEAGELKDFVASHRSGSPEKIILEESENCDYVVMGTHGKSSDLGCEEIRRMGGTAAGVIESIRKPILLVKPTANLHIENGRWTPQKVLIPLSGEPCPSQAFFPAMEILSKTSAEINILHIHDSEDRELPAEGSFTAPYYEDYPQHEWSSWSKEFLKRFCPEMKNHFKINVSLSHGAPADEILSFAKKNENDLIVATWHGSMAHLKAKTLKKLLYECSCPILLINLGCEPNT